MALLFSYQMSDSQQGFVRGPTLRADSWIGEHVMRGATFAALGLLTASLGIAQTPASSMKGQVALYSAVGAELTQYLVDIDNDTLAKQGSVTLPAAVQEAWTHPSRRFIYITWSSGGPGAKGNEHGVTAFRIDPATGILQPHGQPIRLASRSIYLTGDATGSHLIVAHNEPSEATVHRIG